jgi:spore maturation protein CgeB
VTDDLRIVFLGLTITSSWGNGHATNYRALLRALEERGHDVLFLEHDTPWYSEHRDMPEPPYGRTELYASLQELRDRFQDHVRQADLVVVGSYVPEGVSVGEWVTATAEGVTAFYDIDTPVTLAKLQRGDFEYLTPGLIARYHVYLSFTGGPILHDLEDTYGSPRAVPFYCVVDPDLYFPEVIRERWDVGYLGTYGADRQPRLNSLLLGAARAAPKARFVVAGPQYPTDIAWPSNVERFEHLPPAQHRSFYCAQRFTLNVTRADMVRAGYSPSVRLFEAAACGTPVISDPWRGLDTFFRPGREILIAHSGRDTLRYLEEVGDEERVEIGRRARQRVLSQHTALHRAIELESCVEDAPAPARLR